jgi:type I restriction enzyme M protein
VCHCCEGGSLEGLYLPFGVYERVVKASKSGNNFGHGYEPRDHDEGEVKLLLLYEREEGERCTRRNSEMKDDDAQEGSTALVDEGEQCIKQLWETINSVRAQSAIKFADYTELVLALLLLRFIDQSTQSGALVPQDRFSALLEMPGERIGEALNTAMDAVEGVYTDLCGALPKGYTLLDAANLSTLVRAFSPLSFDLGADIFTRACDGLLARFAVSERTSGSEFFTPTVIKQLMVEVLAPVSGRAFDPACGSGGLLVECARYASLHTRSPRSSVTLYGQEKVSKTVRLCKINLFLHGLHGEIDEGNSFYEGQWQGRGCFDTVLTDPFFNLRGVQKERIRADPRYPFGVPRTDNANALWLQICYSALADTGRAGIVMANSACDARGSDQALRRLLILDGAVDVVLAIGPGFFFTSAIACTLWFFDKAKQRGGRKEHVLFIDARHLSHRVERVHSTFLPKQIEFFANIVRLYRGFPLETERGSGEHLLETFPSGGYADVPGLCKAASLAEVEEQEWSLNPGRYVGIQPEQTHAGFKEQLLAHHREFLEFNRESRVLEEQIRENTKRLLDGC